MLLLGLGLLGALLSMIRRLRRTDGVQRQQLRLIAASAGLVAGGFAVLLTVQILNGGRQTWASSMPLFVSYFCMPILFAVAVLRFRLYDIEVILNRTLVVALGTAFAGVGYTALVVTVGQAVDTRAGGFWVSILATALVALAFQPLRRGVVRAANRLAFGPRAKPYEALTDFGRRLSQTPSAETLLLAAAEAACRSVSATSTTAVLEMAGEAPVSVTWPPGTQPSATSHVVDVTEDETTLGRLQVSLPPGRPLSEADHRLLGELAEQSAVAFRNVALERGLAAEVASLDDAARALAESRRRLVVAEDTARRRLEEELRRRVLPRLEPMPAQIRSLAAAPLSGEGCAEVERLVAETNTALEALRDLTRGVFPTVLEGSGLAAALGSRHGAAPAPALLHVGAGADARLPAHVETAAYASYRAAAATTDSPLEVTMELEHGTPDELVLTLVGLDPALLDARGAPTAWRRPVARCTWRGPASRSGSPSRHRRRRSTRGRDARSTSAGHPACAPATGPHPVASPYSGAMTVRVVFADDNYLVREGVAGLLTETPDIDLVETVADPDALHRAVATHRPDAVLTDIRMPPSFTTEGIVAAKRIRAEFPSTGVVVLSQYIEEEYAFDLLSDGVEGLGYLLKERVTQVDELVRALHAVADGGSALDPKVVEGLLARKSGQASSPLLGLTDRELEVLQQVATGLSNAATAKTLFMSERAVEKHISSVFQKLGLVHESDMNRRVMAVLAFLDATGGPGATPVR